MTYTLPELSYPYNALEPYFDELTMKIHHTKHHQTYVDKLNAALESHQNLKNKPVEELLKNLNAIPESIKTAVRNHGGGHFNHSFWWPMLKKNIEFKGEVSKAIISTFGSYDKFKEELKNVALSRFGSGWAWLVIHNGKLEIYSTPNQDCPLSEGKIPILGIDMWEHSWYLKHNANKSAYVEDFFHVINWEQVNENFKQTKR